jgi:YD repeat-containing protein
MGCGEDLLPYDGDNRLTSRDAPETSDDITLTYDAAGRVVSQSGGG